jgi:tetratricopeptide (TPR) repeat protein
MFRLNPAKAQGPIGAALCATLLLSGQGLLPTEAFAAAKATPISTVDNLLIEAQSNYNHGRYKEAVELFEKVQAEESLSTYQKSELQLGLAECYRQTGKFKKSEELFKTAIKEAEEEDSKNLNKKAKRDQKHVSDLVPLMMNDLSLLYLEQSRFQECEQLLDKCIELAERKVGDKSIDLTLPMNALTHLYVRWGRFTDAKNESVKTMQLFVTPAQKNSWLFAYTAYNLAEILKSKGDYKNAEKLRSQRRNRLP